MELEKNLDIKYKSTRLAVENAIELSKIHRLDNKSWKKIILEEAFYIATYNEIIYNPEELNN